MRKKKVGILFGMEDTFPWALIQAINERGGDSVGAEACEISYLKDDGAFPYDLILDRISHEVPFYRTYLKCAAASGVKVVNNPIWWSADDKFFDNLVAKAANVAVPRTVLLPHKEYPPSTEATSFRNMRWVNWDEVFDYMNTVELAMRDGIPYAIDFMNCAPDADRKSVGEENFKWMVDNMAEVLIETVTGDKPLELTGNWPTIMNTSKPADQPI